MWKDFCIDLERKKKMSSFKTNRQIAYRNAAHQ